VIESRARFELEVKTRGPAHHSFRQEWAALKRLFGPAHHRKTYGVVDTYFDTGDHRLLEARCCLRTRRSSSARKRYVFKESLAPWRNVRVARELVDITGPAVLDLTNAFHRRLPTVARTVRVLGGGSPDGADPDVIRTVRPVACLKTVRDLWWCQLPCSPVDIFCRVFVDHVDGFAVRNATLTRVLQFSELEIELHSDDTAPATVDLFDQAIERLATNGPIAWTPLSKFGFIVESMSRCALTAQEESVI